MGTKLGWAIAAVVSFLVGLFLRGADVQGVTPDGITVDQREFSVRGDSGADLVMMEIPLTNRSDSKDRLVGMRSSCQCVTTADLPHEVLAGESWSLPLRINSSTYSPGDHFVFELTLFLESGSAVPVQIDFVMADGQSSRSIGSDEKEL